MAKMEEITAVMNLVCVACDAEIQPKADAVNTLGNGQLEIEEPKDRKFLTNPDKFSSLLKYFIPDEQNEEILSVFSTYKYQLPFCPECMDVFDRISYVEKEIETLKEVIDSLASCIKVKIQTSFGNLPTDVELNEDVVKMKIFLMGMHSLDDLPDIIERAKESVLPDEGNKAPTASTSTTTTGRAVMIKAGDESNGMCEIVHAFPVTTTTTTDEDGTKVMDTETLAAVLGTNQVTGEDGDNCPDVEVEVELEGTGDSPRKSKRTIRIPSRFLEVAGEGTQIFLLEDNDSWVEQTEDSGIVEQVTIEEQPTNDDDDVEFLEEDNAEAIEHEVQTIVEANKVAKKLLDSAGLPPLTQTPDLPELTADILKKKKKKTKHKVVEVQAGTYEYRGHQFAKTETGYDCVGCGKQFRARGNVLSHIKARHLGISAAERRKKNPKRKTDRRQRTVTEIQPGVFQFEGLTFAKQEDGRFQCGVCSNVLKTRDSALVHLKQRHLGEGLGNFLCHACGKSFERDVYLKLHQVVHAKNARKHSCNICGKTFTHPSNLYNHKKIHVGELKHVCEYEGCGKKFLTKKQLVNHTKRQHTDERPHHCQLCPKQFVLTSELVIHMRSHLEDRRYECHLCDSKFFIRFRLKRHLQRVHKLAPEEITEETLSETIPSPVKTTTTTNTITVVLEAEDPIAIGKNPTELNQYITYNNLF